MSHWSNQFSVPLESSIESVFETIADTDGRAVVAWIITKYREDIAARSHRLVDFILEWTQNSSTLVFDGEACTSDTQVRVYDDGTYGSGRAARLTGRRLA